MNRKKKKKNILRVSSFHTSRKSILILHIDIKEENYAFSVEQLSTLKAIISILKWLYDKHNLTLVVILSHLPPPHLYRREGVGHIVFGTDPFGVGERVREKERKKESLDFSSYTSAPDLISSIGLNIARRIRGEKVRQKFRK